MNIQNLTMNFKIEESAAADRAEEQFFQICGFHLSDPLQRKLERQAHVVREHLRTQMDIRAAVRFFESPVLLGDALQLDDATLYCSAFEQIPADAVKGAFVYLLTIGETNIEEETDILTELYHDIWGTTYVGAALEVLRRDLLNGLLDSGLHLSESFGPGYYGMELEEGRKLYGLMDKSLIGVLQKTSGLLVPEKSCLGLMLVYDRGDIKMPGACEKCLGARGGCQFCDKRYVKELE